MLYEITILCYLFFPTRSSYPLHPSTVACVPGRRIPTEKYNNIYCVLFNAINVYNMFFEHFFCLVDLLLFFFPIGFDIFLYLPDTVVCRGLSVRPNRFRPTRCPYYITHRYNPCRHFV